MTDEQDKKTAGKFAWFCLGTIMGMRGISKITHAVYLIIIVILLTFAIPQCSQTLDRVLQIGHIPCPEALSK